MRRLCSYRESSQRTHVDVGCRTNRDADRAECTARPGRWSRGVDFLLTSQYDTGNGVEESVRFLLMSLYDLEFGVEESIGPGILHVQYGWIDGVEESVFDQDSPGLHHPPSL